MKSAIILKLQRELAEPISTERQVVYILVEIRKLLETNAALKKKYDALWFHASWAVHAEMRGWDGIAAKLLQYFDEAYPLLREKELHELPRELGRAVEDAMSLDHFRRHLQDFLTEQGLNTSIAKKYWTEFLRLYASVIQDSPLIVSQQNIKNLSNVVVTVEDAPQKLAGLDDMKYQLYQVRWVCHATDGNTGELFTLFTIP
jgi:hypothetical protein